MISEFPSQVRMFDYVLQQRLRGMEWVVLTKDRLTKSKEQRGRETRGGTEGRVGRKRPRRTPNRCGSVPDRSEPEWNFLKFPPRSAAEADKGTASAQQKTSTARAQHEGSLLPRERGSYSSSRVRSMSTEGKGVGLPTG